jgi:hypothetical protein
MTMLGHPGFIQAISEDAEFPNGCFARSFYAFFAHPAAPRLLSLALFSRSFICKQQQRQLAKREEREREGRIMNLQIAPSWMTNILSMRAQQIIDSTMTPSWMTNYNLDERKSDYQLTINPS